MARLEGLSAIISGAAMGQGAAEARLFAAEGARVIIADVADEEAHALAAEINDRQSAEVAIALHLDVRCADGWADAVALAERRFGGLDILVNNAAILAGGDIETSTEDDWDRVIAINLKGTWLGMRAAVPAMRRRGGGAIINISSIGGLVGGYDFAAYQAAKGAVRLLARQGARKYGRDGIRCNTVYPGPIMTPMLSARDEKEYATTVRMTALGRMGRPDEVAQAVLFLASRDASYVTGADLTVDGGFAA